MTDVVNEARRKVSEQCLTVRCRKGGCWLTLNNAPLPYILIDMDSPQAPARQNERKCDYIFIGGSDIFWAGVIKLKRGKPNASEAVPQLRARSQAADRIVPRNAQVQFRPIMVYGGRLRRVELDRLTKTANMIRFRNQTERIRLVRCGTALVDALNKSQSG